MIYIFGLGNPGEEYKDSRHNAGRELLQYFAKKNNFPEFDMDKKSNSLISKSEIGKEKTALVLPETFMNRSGKSVAYFIKAPTGKKKEIKNLIVVYDDLDLPLGTIKISYNKSSGGHNGLESIIKAVKSLEFVRIRIGVSPTTPKGKIKKPGINLPSKQAEKKVIDFILSNFSPKEKESLKKVYKIASEALETIVSSGRERAMNVFN